jgi:hypothetical protein
MQFWMLPAQLGLSFMESGLALMASARPAATDAPPKDPGQIQASARAAEEQAAHIDDGPDVIATPAGLVA